MAEAGYPCGPLPSVVVVGAGITGLACAWHLRGRARVTVLEAAPRAGGKVFTYDAAAGPGFGDVPLEAGPDLFLARVPWAVDLCREVGLGEELVAPATGRAFVWSRGRMTELPDGLVLGVPRRLAPLARSGLVSPRGMVRAALDLVLPARRKPVADPSGAYPSGSDPSVADPSVADVVSGRLGREVLERVVEPLLGGIHAGRADMLSLHAVAPDVAAAAHANRSLILGLRRAATTRSTAPGGPVFLTVRGGLGRLVDRLASGLDDLRFSAAVLGISPGAGSALSVTLAGGDAVATDACVLAVPAFAAAPIVEAASPAASGELRAIRYASVATITLAWDPARVGHPLDGSGFLVPRVDGRLVTACTFLTTKWPELGGRGVVLLRASVGRLDDERALALDDPSLVAGVTTELREALSLAGEPAAASVARWPRALPQHEPGHSARVMRIRAALDHDLPGVAVAGAAYDGLGIAACVRQGREAAEKVLSDLGAAGGRP